MLTSVRRFVVFQAFLIWQGGFLFYSAVVVPVGTELLGSAREQGLITQRVTDWLNLAGAGWAVAFGWDVFAAADPARRRTHARRLGWATCVALLALLAWWHTDLDRLLDRDTGAILDRRAFRRLHVAYLWASTAHWLIALVLAWLTLRAWRDDDRHLTSAPSPHDLTT